MILDISPAEALLSLLSKFRGYLEVSEIAVTTTFEMASHLKVSNRFARWALEIQSYDIKNIVQSRQSAYSCKPLKPPCLGYGGYGGYGLGYNRYGGYGGYGSGYNRYGGYGGYGSGYGGYGSGYNRYGGYGYNSHF
ncbi:hypothetical protein CEXT_36651 [Caerostris extrusa]|uniref:Uncharacterized protein n=1 Tax=Caerostris extrusa TaxID=172846 RepID=A0AAV4U3J9_CAEEX|nr:hypothetical protein CEXT_36651 [Caerostris extrusa]